MSSFKVIVASVVLLVGCTGDPSPAVDMSVASDVILDLATPLDVGSELAPADLRVLDVRWPSDVSGPIEGFGLISGECGVLDDELTATESNLVTNALDFGTDPYDDSDLARLTAGGQEIIADGNAGGNSLLSEVFAYEMLARCEGAVLLKTETEVEYTNPMGKITDLLVEIDGHRIGVSVTRAIAFPFDDPYTDIQAVALLTDKLNDISLSTANVASSDAWTKQILSVIAYTPMHADSLRAAYGMLDAGTKSDTIVLVTVTNGEDAPLY